MIPLKVRGLFRKEDTFFKKEGVFKNGRPFTEMPFRDTPLGLKYLGEEINTMPLRKGTAILEVDTTLRGLKDASGEGRTAGLEGLKWG